MTEIEFEKAVVELAHLFGWRAAAFRPAQTGKGWRTPVKYDGKGYPDLTLVHPTGYIIFAELKADKGRPSPEQNDWIMLLSEAAIQIAWRIDREEWQESVSCFVWRPRDLDEIARRLSFGRAVSGAM